jgi:hypothetical protein
VSNILAHHKFIGDIFSVKYPTTKVILVAKMGVITGGVGLSTYYYEVSRLAKEVS